MPVPWEAEGATRMIWGLEHLCDDEEELVSMRGAEPWNSCLGECVECPSLETFRKDFPPGSAPVPGQGLGLGHLQRSLQPQLSCDSGNTLPWQFSFGEYEPLPAAF